MLDPEDQWVVSQGMTKPFSCCHITGMRVLRPTWVPYVLTLMLAVVSDTVNCFVFPSDSDTLKARLADCLCSKVCLLLF